MMKMNLLGGACAAAVLAALGASAAFAAEVSGRVTGGDAGVALEGATVRIDELGRETTTTRDGRYRFSDVPAGEYTLKVVYVGAGEASAPLSVGDADASADFALTTGSSREQIVVVGQRGSLYSALSQKKASDSLVEVLSADAIGQFPDQNVSESARRVPGVQVENDQGEGRFVVIRGLDPSLNAAAINGVRIPAPESDVRAVALDVIDSDVLESIVITKSLTPDQDGDAIGGTIDIKTISAFDRDGLFLKGEIAGNYTESTDTIRPKASLTASQQFNNGLLGVSGSLSYRERQFATENVEVDGPWDIEDGALWNEELELRDYVVTRERLNAALNFDLRPNADHDLYLRTLYSDFEDLEYRRRVELKLDDADIVSVDGDELLFGGEIEIDRDSKDRLETQRIWSSQFGGQSRADLWTLDYQIAYSHAEESEPNSLDAVTFRAEFDGDGFLGLNTADPLRPLIVRDVADALPIDDASLYEIDSWENVDGLTEDEEAAYRFDVRRDLSLTGADAYIKGGYKLRQRNKFYDVDIPVYEGPDGLTLLDLATGVDYPLDTFGPAADSRAIRDFFNTNLALLELDGGDTEIASTVEDYDAEEDVQAAYVMGSVDFGKLAVVGGVRVEMTEFSATATQFLENELGDELFVPVSVSKDYDDVLPSLTARYDWSDNLVIRGAYYRALARPNFGQIVPRAEIEFDDVEDGVNFFEGAGGNPDLDRQTADNFDASIEYYIGGSGLISAGVFYKDIENYIAEQLLVGEFYGLQFSELESALNLESAEVLGVELNYQQALDMLPEPFDGFIVGANVSLSESEAVLPGGRKIDLPKLSDTIANVVLGYEKGPIDLRASLSHRSEYLDVINGGFDEGLDRFVDTHTQIDLTGKYAISDQLRLFVELTNINDEPFLAFVPIEGRKALLQYEEYGYSASAGLKFTY